MGKDGLTKVFEWFLGDTVFSIKKREEEEVKIKLIKYYNEEEARTITTGGIVHRRGDNSLVYWMYTNDDISDSPADDTGELGERIFLEENSSEIPNPS